jgi:hypothetical protein
MSLILDGTNGLSDVDGSASTPAIRGTDANTGIFFPAADTIAFAEGGAEVARIDSSGNLGINTTSPSDRLDVVSGSSTYRNRVRNSTANEAFLLFQNSNSGTTTTDGFLVGLDSDANGYLYNYENKPILFGTNNAERMRIADGGSLLVGRTASINSEQFAVRGPAGDANNWLMTLQSQATSVSVTMIAFYDGSNTFCGQVYIDAGANVTYYATSSDYRLKENVAPMTGALAKVQQLNPVTYNWKKSGKESQGFIAHELKEVVPECVIGEKDAVDENGNIVPQMVDTSFLVATLTAAIQEQQQIINDLKLRIETLENK